MLLPRARLTLVVSADLDQVMTVVRMVGAAAGFSGLGSAPRARLELALAETLTNVVRHAYRDQPGARIEVHVESDAEGTAVEVRDSGLPLDAMDVHDSADAADPALAESGRGLWIVRESVSAAAYHRDGPHNVWRLVQRSGD